MRDRGAVRCVGLGALAVSMVAMAGTAHADCSVQTSGIEFPKYDVFATQQDATQLATIRVECAEPTAYRIELDGGQNASFFPRRMIRSGTDGSSSQDRIEYNLYVSAGDGATVWGDGSGSTTPVAGFGTDEEHTVYGRVGKGQDVHVGNYSDTVLITVMLD